MRSSIVAAVVLSVVVASLACERRRESPAVGDASTTAATTPRGERPLEPAADAGEEPAAPREPARPEVAQPAPVDERARARERALERATLTIVQAADRDRNLGIVPPEPARVEIDGGACDVGIEIRPSP